MISQKSASYANFFSVYQPIMEKKSNSHTTSQDSQLLPYARYNVVQGSHSELMDYLQFRPYLIFGAEYQQLFAWHSSKQLSSILRAQSIGTGLSTGIKNSPSLPFHPLSPHPPPPCPIFGNSYFCVTVYMIASDGYWNFIVRYKHLQKFLKLSQFFFVTLTHTHLWPDFSLTVSSKGL